jgi:hypothetical protein
MIRSLDPTRGHATNMDMDMAMSAPSNRLETSRSLESTREKFARKPEPPVLLAPIRPDRRCARCREIVPQSYETFLHRDFRTLRISADRGCSICRFLYDEVAFEPYLQDIEPSRETKLRLIGHGQKFEVINFSLKSKFFEFYQRRGLSRNLLPLLHPTR